MYVVKKRIKGREYLYLCKTRRKGNKICRKTICYLAPLPPGQPDECATINRAIEYLKKTNNKQKVEGVKKLIILDRICSKIKTPLLPTDKMYSVLADACYKHIRENVFDESFFSNLAILLENDIKFLEIRTLLAALLKSSTEFRNYENRIKQHEANRNITRASQLFKNSPVVFHPMEDKNKICAAILRTVKKFPVLKTYLLAITRP